MLILLNFHKKCISFVDQLVKKSCEFKIWKTVKDDYHLDDYMYFQWAQLIHAILQTLKNKAKQNLKANGSDVFVLNHYFIRNVGMLVLDKLTVKKIYPMLILSLIKNKPISQR